MSVLPVIVGPTAAGKTALSLQISQFLPVEIISADSRQIYRKLDIGTAKVEEEIREKVTHHFIDIMDPSTAYSAGEYSTQAREKIKEITAKKITPLVVGGSGLYIRALIDGFSVIGAKDEEIRRELENGYEREGSEVYYNQLKERDPEYASKISPRDKQRILRALEVCLVSGKNFTYWHKKESRPAAFSPLMIGLTMPRELLYEKINNRVEEMIERGLLKEVENLKVSGYSAKQNALNTVGYKEVFSYLNGDTSFNEMKELIKRNSRRYAKRQLTWFNKDKRIIWFSVKERASIYAIAQKVVQQLPAASFKV